MNRPRSIEFTSHGPADTRRLATCLAAALPGGLVIALDGTLGAGKTFLVQSIAQARGVKRGSVTSPTFSLIQVYPGDLPLVHIDAYRIADVDEYQQLGIDELIDAGGVTLMEWADRFEDQLPADRLTVSIEVEGETTRRFVIGWPESGPLARTCGQALVRSLADQLPKVD